MDFLPVFTAGKVYDALEEAVLLKSRSFPDGEEEWNAVLVRLSRDIIHGQHLEVLESFQDTPLSIGTLVDACLDEYGQAFDLIRKQAMAFLDQSSVSMNHVFADSTVDERGVCILLLGVACLELYCRCNYTGPELSSAERKRLDFDNEVLGRRSVSVLECDGHYPYSLVDMPHLLLIGRSLISFVAEPERASWRTGISLSEDGQIVSPKFDANSEDMSLDEDVIEDLQRISSAHWWNARAVVLHVRLLQKQRYEEVPTLWDEVNSQFTSVLTKHCGVRLMASTPLTKFDVSESELPDECTENEQKRMLAGIAWLEWGLALHHFEFGDQGKKCFQQAKEVLGLETKLSAALGKRTKYQREDIAQLFLYAKSHLVSQGIVGAEEERKEIGILEQQLPVKTEEEQDKDDMTSASSSRPDYEWEIGKRAINEVNTQTGEEAAMREILLDTIDTGAAENIVLEGGPHFQDVNAHDDGGQLHPLDQAVVLSLCLDVQNSNPVDGLTNAEMLPYVERVLTMSKNWMIHSTALLQRSWLEFERRKTADRAMLQIQALIDQHTTRLTIFQSTYKSIEESAPAQDRLLYIYHIIYPSQFELKRDLAMKYLQCQVFMSALNYFKELEMWDEVVTCYQLMNKPHRAEVVVREQLKIAESPSMVNALADLTGKEDLYERAWEISKGRYPRAKRTLGKICHDRGDFADCCKHLDAALAVQPLMHSTWYLKGIACMKLNWWEEGLSAFVRCVQQEPESGEAWTNLGAIHMRLKNWSKAHHALTEAAKHKRDDWRVFENLMMVNLAMQRWKEALRHMQTLLDMRYKSQRPLHLQELGYIIKVVVNLTHASVQAEKETAMREDNQEFSDEHVSMEEHTDDQDMRSEERDVVVNLPDLAATVERLLQNITNAVKSDPAVWNLVAVFQSSLGRYAIALEARVKQWRAVISDSNWEKDEAKIRELVDVAMSLVDAHKYKEVTDEYVYSSKMLLQTAIKRLQTLIELNSQPSSPESNLLNAYREVMERLQSLLETLNGMQCSVAQ